MHADEAPVSLPAARALISAQFPQYRDLLVSPLAGGTDHAIFRVGENIAARFPRRHAARPERPAAEHNSTPVSLGFVERLLVDEASSMPCR